MVQKPVENRFQVKNTQVSSILYYRKKILSKSTSSCKGEDPVDVSPTSSKKSRRNRVRERDLNPVLEGQKLRDSFPL